MNSGPKIQSAGFVNKKRTFYWLNGTREVLEGYCVADCMQQAGYSAGALHALDFVADGDDQSYIWLEGHWVKLSTSGEKASYKIFPSKEDLIINPFSKKPSDLKDNKKIRS